MEALDQRLGDRVADNGKLIATHFAGPTWQAGDGSTVVGQRVDGHRRPHRDPLAAAVGRTDPTGSDGDRLAGRTYIQRIATTGGLVPPAADCTEATVGTQAEVPYTADYYFWKKGG